MSQITEKSRKNNPKQQKKHRKQANHSKSHVTCCITEYTN